jgi:2-octaprenyl-6-methoxyphenol hydroxylase
LHPIAGQGFNLGLRDAAELAEVIAKSYRQGEDFGALANLQSYANARRPDQIQVALITDSLARVFSNRFDPLARVRMAGLLAIDLLPPLKHAVARRAMGFVGRLPRLARGLPL